MQNSTNISSTFSEYCTGYYGFAFNGQEKDQEIYNNQSTTTAMFWEYDGRIGRRWNVDPKFVEKPWLSPFHTFSNNPILNVDYNGDNDGDYYNKEGKNLGSDGKTITDSKTGQQVPDNKAYVCESVTKGKDGLVSSAVNSKDIGLSNTDLLNRAHWAYGETSGGIDVKGVAFAIDNSRKNFKSEKGLLNSVLFQDANFKGPSDFFSGTITERLDKINNKSNNEKPENKNPYDQFTAFRNGENSTIIKKLTPGFQAAISASIVAHMRSEADPTFGATNWLSGMTLATQNKYNSNGNNSLVKIGKHYFYKW